jgi:hypothetical protein
MRTLAKAMLIAGVLMSAQALAKKPVDFREPNEMTEADYRQTQKRSPETRRGC